MTETLQYFQPHDVTCIHTKIHSKRTHKYQTLSPTIISRNLIQITKDHANSKLHIHPRVNTVSQNFQGTNEQVSLLGVEQDPESHVESHEIVHDEGPKCIVSVYPLDVVRARSTYNILLHSRLVRTPCRRKRHGQQRA